MRKTLTENDKRFIGMGNWIQWVHVKTKGRNIDIGPHTTIGQEGFGFERDEDGYKIPLDRMLHPFKVIIHDNVEIGSGCAIHRGRWRDTVIGEGTKIDSLVHVAHNVHIGKHCLVVAGTVIGGSVTIGDHCFIGENVSIRQGVKIADHVTIGMGSIVRHDIEQSNSTWVMQADPALRNGNLTMVKIADVQKF